MSYVIVAGQEYEIDTPEQVAEARAAIAHNLPASEPNRVPVWAGAPGCPDSYRTNDFLTGDNAATTTDYSKTAAGRFSAASKHVTTAPVVRMFDTLVDEARARGLSVGDAVRDVVYSVHANDVRRLLDRSDAREMSAYMRHIGGVDLGG